MKIVKDSNRIWKRIFIIVAFVLMIFRVSALLGYDDPTIPRVDAPTSVASTSTVINVSESIGNWSQYPAVSDVDFDEHGGIDIGDSTFSGNNYTWNYDGMVDFFFMGTSGIIQAMYWDGTADTWDFLVPIYSTQPITSSRVTLNDDGLTKSDGSLSLETSDITSEGTIIQNMLECNENLGYCDLRDYPLKNAGNITASYFIGDGSQLTGISGGNLSFNQSLTDTLYAGIQWNYNQSDGAGWLPDDFEENNYFYTLGGVIATLASGNLLAFNYSIGEDYLKSVDFFGRSLFSSLGEGEFLSLDWDNRKLYSDDGLTPSLDWSGQDFLRVLMGLNVSGNLTAQYYFGDGSQLIGINGMNYTSLALTNQSNTFAENINATGTITANLFNEVYLHKVYDFASSGDQPFNVASGGSAGIGQTNAFAQMTGGVWQSITSTTINNAITLTGTYWNNETDYSYWNTRLKTVDSADVLYVNGWEDGATTGYFFRYDSAILPNWTIEMTGGISNCYYNTSIPLTTAQFIPLEIITNTSTVLFKYNGVEIYSSTTANCFNNKVKRWYAKVLTRTTANKELRFDRVEMVGIKNWESTAGGAE